MAVEGQTVQTASTSCRSTTVAASAASAAAGRERPRYLHHIAAALGENTGTTSYHLRLLADAGVIEEIPERAHGRERWWRTIPTDLREPDYESLSPEERAALDEWRAGQIPGELALVNRFVRDVRRHGKWAKASHAGGYYTAEGLAALHEDYVALLGKYGYTAQDAPPGARLMQLRMFYIPDDPAGEPEPGS